MYYIYILESSQTAKFYIGYTTNLEQRLQYHNTGLQRWTRNKGPWKLVYSEQFSTKKEAILRENQIKNKKSRRYIEYLITNGTIGG